MSETRNSLKYAAFAWMALFGLAGGLFVAGEAFADPGGWPAIGLTAAWFVPLAALAALAVLRPLVAVPVFIGATALVGAFTLADGAFGVIPREDWGPVAVVVVFAIGVALAFLGLRRATLAGTLIVALAAAQLVATLLSAVVHDAGDGPGPRALLGGSSGVVIVPLLVAGLLFLAAGRREHVSPTEHEPPVHV